MNDHERLQRHLSEWLRGELEPAVSDETELHVRSCVRCRGWLRTRDLLAAALEIRDVGGPGRHPGAEPLARYAVEPASLDVAERESVSSHLAGCASCARELDLARRALAAASAAGPVRRLQSRPWRAAGGRRRPSGLDARDGGRRSAQTGASLLLAAGLVAGLLVAARHLERAAIAPRTFLVTEQTLQGERVLVARDQIEVRAARIGTGATVTLRANTVILGEGFAVDASSRVVIGNARQTPLHPRKPATHPKNEETKP